MRTWLFAFGLIAAVTAAGRALHLNPSAMGFAYLIAVLAISMRGQLVAGTVSSILAALCFNFFFFPPLYTLTIAEPANWFALVAFLVASITVNRLVALTAERERFLEANAHLQALRESEALKTSLLRAISHDLTTPLTAIVLRTESLRRRLSSDRELLDDVVSIGEETGRLRRRIDNLLAMARMEAGRTKPRAEPTPPGDLFRSARENLPLVFQSRPIALHVDAECPDMNVDPSLVMEILVNLVENAHRVSPPGAAIEISAQRHPLDRDKVRIEVLDRGPGLPPAAADETSDVVQRGLGLEIARSFAAANGGTCVLSPRPGGGTVACIDLPAALPATEAV